MNCDTAEESLLDYLEGQLDAQETDAMRSHIDNCATCRRALRETRELIDAIEHARRRQEKAWQQASRASGSSDSAQRARSFTFEAGHQLGDFEIQGEIGRGGMGVVYRARQITLNRVVALKVLPASVCQTESAVSRFVREAQAAAKLHHTNIVPVYAQGESDGHFYYAMELIDGPNLGWLMKDDRSAILSGIGAVTKSGIGTSTDASGVTRMEGSTPRRRADYRRIAGLIASVADALEHAHRSNVIHRDIKPQNLLLGKDGEFHITDFGLARLLDEPNMTVTGEMLGTPAYMSPEQVDADRERIDARTDIYSLGVTLYELLSGKRPFEGTSREQVIARVRDREPVSPRKHDPHIPIDLDTICLRAMEKSPHRRYQTAEALAADLRRFAEDKPIHARRVSLIEKGIKWVRRHPAKFTIAMLVVVMIAGGAVWYVQAEAAQRRADEQAEAARQRKANDLVQEAFDLLAYDNYRAGDKARQLLLEASQHFSDQLLYLKAKALSHVIDNPTEAESILKSAMEQQPDDVECMYLMAWVLRRLDRQDECDELVRKADRLRQANGAEWAKRSTVLFFRATAIVRSQPQDAEDSYEQASILRKLESPGDFYYQAILHLGRAKNNAQYHTRNPDDFAAIDRNLTMASTARPEDAYPHYLHSLAFRINAEINLATGNLTKARERFATALVRAEDAVRADSSSPRGYAARAEFWESISDRSVPLGRFVNDDERSAFHSLHKKQAETGKENADCEFCSWLDTSATGALHRATEERTNGLLRCSTDKDRIEFLEYRWLDYYWLGDFDVALKDLGDLQGLVPKTHKLKIWYDTLMPLLITCEQQDVSAAVRQLNSNSLPDLTDYRSVTSLACLQYLLLEEGAARGGLTRAAEMVDFDEGLDRSAEGGYWRSAWSVLADSALLSEESWKSIRNAKKNEIRAPAYFFEGVVALSRGDRDAARRSLMECESCFDYEDYSYLARMLRRRMDADPDWPPWIASSGAEKN